VIPSVPIDELTERLRSRNRPESKEPWAGPYILFLGEGCARAAGAPSAADIAREALSTFGFETISSDSKATDEVLLARFAAHTSNLSRNEVARMLQSLYARVPVPSFYQDLALLIREHFFPLIITTNFDTLLEQALTTAGVRGTDVRVTTFPQREPTTPPTEPLTHLVKLHGDLAQNTAHFLPEDVERALGESRQWIKADLKGDIIMVGHVLSDDPVDRWLAHSPERELWWVSEKRPPDGRVDSWTKNYREITGELGRPQIFFPQLTLRLLRSTPVTQEPPAAARSAAPTAPETMEIPVDTGELSELLQKELVRSQAVLYNLDLEGSAGERPSHIQSQIRYQKQQISKLEDKMRSLPRIKSRVLELMYKIESEVEHYQRQGTDAQLDDVLDYLKIQLGTIETELGKESPNQLLVSGSIGATLTVADRLLTQYGEQVLDSSDVKDLAELAPSVASRVIL